MKIVEAGPPRLEINIINIIKKHDRRSDYQGAKKI
jgi:hypothetical protein